MLPLKNLLSYYLKTMRSTLAIISSLGLTFLASWLLGRMGMDRVLLLSRLEEVPKNVFEWTMFISSAMLRFAPVFGFVEVKTLSEDKKMELKASSMEGHVVLVGLGHLGRRVADLLVKRGDSFCIVVPPTERETNESVDEFKGKGVPTVFGDASLLRTLTTANVEKARALVMTIDDDLKNSVIADRAKKMNADLRIVVRVFRDEIARMLRSSGDADVGISTSLASSPLFLAAITNEIVLTAPPLASIKVEEGSEIDGKGLREIEGMGMGVLALLDGDRWETPPKNYRSKSGDVLLIRL